MTEPDAFVASGAAPTTVETFTATPDPAPAEEPDEEPGDESFTL